MLDNDDIEIRQYLAIAIVGIIIFGLLAYYKSPPYYKDLINGITVICIGILTFGVIAHSIDKDTTNPVLRVIRSVGSHINKRTLFLMALLIPGIPPL